MKLTKLFAAFAVAAMAMTLGSCNSKNPVVEFADAMNAITEKINKTTSVNEFEALNPEFEAADKILTDNADYVLTEDDKTILYDVLTKSTKAIVAKAAEFQGLEGAESQDSYIETQVKALVSKATTLGSLNENNVVEEAEYEQAELIEPAEADSTAVAE